MRTLLFILWGMLLLMLDGVAGNFGIFPVLSFYFALYVSGSVSLTSGSIYLALVAGILDGIYGHNSPMFLLIYPVAFAVSLLLVGGARSGGIAALLLPGAFGGFALTLAREFLLRFLNLPGRGAGIFFSGLLLHTLGGALYFMLSVLCLDFFSRYLGWRKLFRETENASEIRSGGRRP